MTYPATLHPVQVPAASRTIEGIARVVRVEGQIAWLEPEQTTSCGHCSSAGACGVGEPEANGIGTVTRRNQARRFQLDQAAGSQGLCAGERVVIGVDPRALIKGALIAYALPLLTALATGALAQAFFVSDLITLCGMASGLALGLGLARAAAGRLAARGELAPRFLRRAQPGETCGASGERS